MKWIHTKGLIICLIFSCSGLAQTDSSQNLAPTFKISVHYNSALNYYGRTDSLKSTGLFPMAELWFTKDLYVNAAPIFISNAVQSMEYAGTVANLGYLHVTDKLITNLYFMKPFYKENTQLVQSALQAQAGTSFSFLNKMLNLTAGADLKLSDKVDVGATAGIDHLVRKELSNGDVVVIDPSVYLYAGSQNFSHTYNKKRTGFLLLPGGSEQVTEKSSSFNILAYEFSVPVVYAKGQFMMLLTPYYVVPQNLLTIPGRPDLSEQGRNMLYVTLGIKYSF